jgi:hypothetical protein
MAGVPARLVAFGSEYTANGGHNPTNCRNAGWPDPHRPWSSPPHKPLHIIHIRRCPVGQRVDENQPGSAHAARLTSCKESVKAERRVFQLCHHGSCGFLPASRPDAASSANLGGRAALLGFEQGARFKAINNVLITAGSGMRSISSVQPPCVYAERSFSVNLSASSFFLSCRMCRTLSDTCSTGLVAVAVVVLLALLAFLWLISG